MTATFLALGFSLAALAASTRAFGLPNHVYQPLIASAILAVAYHRRWLARPRKAQDYALMLLNFAVLCLTAKLVIGGGVRLPFAWLKFPSIETQTGWLAIPQLVWQSGPLSDWPVDVTRIQSFLFVVTAGAAWIRFQPFASITALLLLVASVPAYADFQWDWVLPAMAATFGAFYVQASVPKPGRSSV